MKKGANTYNVLNEITTLISTTSSDTLGLLDTGAVTYSVNFSAVPQGDPVVLLMTETISSSCRENDGRCIVDQTVRGSAGSSHYSCSSLTCQNGSSKKVEDQGGIRSGQMSSTAQLYNTSTPINTTYHLPATTFAYYAYSDGITESLGSSLSSYPSITDVPNLFYENMAFVRAITCAAVRYYPYNGMQRSQSYIGGTMVQNLFNYHYGLLKENSVLISSSSSIFNQYADFPGRTYKWTRYKTCSFYPSYKTIQGVGTLYYTGNVRVTLAA